MKQDIAWYATLAAAALGLWLLPESWKNTPVTRGDLAFFVVMGVWIAGFYVMGFDYRLKRLEKGDTP